MKELINWALKNRAAVESKMDARQTGQTTLIYEGENGIVCSNVNEGWAPRDTDCIIVPVRRAGGIDAMVDDYMESIQEQHYE